MVKEYKDQRYANFAEIMRRINSKPLGEASFNHLYERYKARAIKGSMDFIVSKDEFRNITSQNCVYCGVEPLQFVKHGKKIFNGHYYHNGIDRIDNTKGYTIDNMVACCGICNKAKRDLSLEEFQAWIDRLVAYQKEK